MDETFIDLDTKWIEEFESLDEKYLPFYSEDIASIKFTHIYVNKDSEVEKLKKDSLLLKEPNYISREEIIGILKRNSKLADKSYSVLSILKYNIDIDPSEIQHFLKNSQDKNIFLKSLTNIDAIPLEKSISMFQDLNEIIIIFYEKPTPKPNKSGATPSASNSTKRIYLNTIKGNKRKTYRKTA